MEPWIVELRQGNAVAAWDGFLARHRGLVFSAIRRYAQDYDDVMDVFAHVCESLRADDLGKLRGWVDQPEHRARFSTWLVTVVRHLTVDWFRHRDGRRRLPALVADLSPLRQLLFTFVFVEQRSHVETFELLRTGIAPGLTFRQFLVELRATYHAATGSRVGLLPRELAIAPPGEDEESREEQVTDAIGRREFLSGVLRSLPDEDRVAVQMYVIDEVPAEVVAKALGYPSAKAVYNRVYRALAGMRARLEQDGLRPEDL